MADFEFKSSINSNEEFLVLDNSQIPGVQSVSMSYQNPAFPLKYIGMQKSDYTLNGQKAGKIDISTLMFNNDFLINYTGDSLCNGALIKSSPQIYSNTLGFNIKNNDYCVYFESGCLVSYTNNYSLNSLPEINASFITYNKLGKYTDSSAGFPSNLITMQNLIGTQNPILNTIGPGSVNFNNSIFDTNRVQSYSINISVNRIPFYTLIKNTPITIKRSLPVQIDCSFDIEINNYNLKDLDSFYSNREFQNINLSINDFFTKTNIQNYNFGNMMLISEEIISSVNNLTRVRLNYQTLKI